MRRSSPCLLLLLTACGPTVIEVKDRLLTTTTTVGVDSTKLCDGSPFGTGTVDVEEDLKNAGIDLSQGCLRSFTFEAGAEFGDIVPGAGCTTVRGTATLTSFAVEASCTVGLERQTLRATCQSSRLEVADGTQVFNALNACLDELERTQAEPLRKLINACKPTKLKLTAEGTCSADLCFSANIKYGLKTKNVVAQLGGTCP